MSDSEDENIKHAIRLSLQESSVDPEQNDIDRAIALSLQQEHHDNDSSNSTAQAAADRVSDHNDDMRTAIALSLGKSVDQLTAREALGLTAATKDVVEQYNKRKRQEEEEGTSDSSSNKKTMDQRYYWDGVVKLTHVTGFTGPNFIRFEDIVEKDKLKKAVITAMVVSMDWIEEQFPSHINLCVVLHGRPVSIKMTGPCVHQMIES